jgi:hypothetical protein
VLSVRIMSKRRTSGAVSELVLGAERKAEDFLRDHPEAEEHVDKVVWLIEGFETPYGVEILATVHWAVERKGAKSLEEAVKLVQAWNPRKGDLFESSTSALLGNSSKQKAGSLRSLSSTAKLLARRAWELGCPTPSGW